jgi:hypothetical protein
VKRLAGVSGKGRPIPPRNYTAVLIGSILIVYILIALLFTYQYRRASKGSLSWSGSNMGICSWIEFGSSKRTFRRKTVLSMPLTHCYCPNAGNDLPLGKASCRYRAVSKGD